MTTVATARAVRRAGAPRPEDRRLIRAAPVFVGLDDATFDRLAGAGVIETMAEGRTLFVQGDPAEAFYVVLEGWVQLVRDGRDGARTVIKLTGPGESFAEALLMPGACYPVSGEAATPLRLARFETARFRALLKHEPDLALAVVSATFQQMHRLVDQIEHLKTWSVERRVADMLLQMHRSAGSPGDAFTLPVGQVLIAARLSVTPSTLSRTLRKLRALGVEANRGRVTLRDPERLAGFVAAAGG